jgi:hypothetical protein
MGICQQIIKITINLTHDCGVQIPQTLFIKPLGVIHVAGRRQGCGRQGQRLDAAVAARWVVWQQPNGGPTTTMAVAVVQWQQR